MSEINSVSSGSGPHLLLLHGLFGDLDNLSRLARVLESRYRVTRADLPGHGDSGSTAVLDIDAMADALLPLLDTPGDCRLFGHSLGGKVAMRMAADERCPPLTALIIADVAPRRYPPHHGDIIAALRALDPATVTSRRAADALLAERIDDPRIRGFLLKSLARNADGSYRWQFDVERIARDYDAIADAPTLHHRIDAPTLFVRGALSDYIRDEDWPAIETLFSRAELATVDDAGHWLHAEKPDEFAQLCLGFLERIDGSAA